MKCLTTILITIIFPVLSFCQHSPPTDNDSLWALLTNWSEINKERDMGIILNCNLLPKYCELFENNLNSLQKKVDDIFSDYKIEIKRMTLDINISNTNNLLVSLSAFYNFESDTSRDLYKINSKNGLLLHLDLYQKVIIAINHYTKSVTNYEEIKVVITNNHYTKSITNNYKELKKVHCNYQFNYCKDYKNKITFFGSPERFNFYQILCCTEKYGDHFIANNNIGNYAKRISLFDLEHRIYLTDLFKLDIFSISPPYSLLDGSLQNSANIYEYFGLKY